MRELNPQGIRSSLGLPESTSQMPTCRLVRFSRFWATVCKTVCPVLLDRCLSRLVCDVGIFWPNGWMDQDATWHVVGVNLGHIVLDGDPASVSPQKGHGPQFSVHVCCGQTAGWIKMPFGTEIRLGPGHIVLDWDPVPPYGKGHSSPPLFGPYLLWPNGRPSQQLLSSCCTAYG